MRDVRIGLCGWTIGMREYYSVIAWNRDMPRNGSGANLEYLRSSIPRFYNSGARFMSAESSDNWGPMGLGYYLASRILWNIDEANRVDELKSDFERPDRTRKLFHPPHRLADIRRIQRGDDAVSGRDLSGIQRLLP